MSPGSHLGKKNVRSAEELLDRICEATGWRKQELLIIKGTVIGNAGSAKLTAIRSAVSLLYAHWEGAIKEIALAYMCYVAYKQLPYSELQDNFLAIRLKRLHHKCQKSEKSSYYFDHINNFTEFQNENMCRSFYEGTIETKSNLNNEVLREVFFTIGFRDKDQVFALKQNLIDEVLLKYRNAIVHGDRIIGEQLIDQERYLELHSGIVKMIDSFSMEVLEMALAESFRRNR